MGMWRQVVEGLLVKRGMPVPPDFYERTEPVSLHDGCVMVHEEFGLGQDAESLYEELCADVRAAYARVPLLPGARDFLQELACAGIPMVMASSTPVRELRSCLETHGIAGFFKDVVSTEDVGGRDKEFPDVYEEALRRLKEAPVRRDMVERVSCRKRWFSRTANHRFDVVAVDCGIKHNIIRKLNEVGGANGIGIIDIVENRLIGMKDRGVYETPGGTILYFAHEQLEMLTVDKDTLHEKQKLAVDLADQIYNGKWYSPLTEALVAFANESNKYVTGSVKLKLYKGNIIPAGTTSPYSLYSENLVTFGESDYDQAQAAGFINLWGLPTKVQALREQGKL